MEKKKINIAVGGGMREDIMRAEKAERKRVNVVLDEGIHKESVKLAERLRLDFSTFVNLMLEAALSGEEQDQMVASMYATVLRRRGYTVVKGTDASKGEKQGREQAKKRKN